MMASAMMRFNDGLSPPPTRRRGSDTLPSRLLALMFGSSKQQSPSGSASSTRSSSFEISTMDLFHPIPESLLSLASSMHSKDEKGLLLEMEEEDEDDLAAIPPFVDEDEGHDVDYEADDEAEPKRSVTFFEHVKVIEIPSHRSYTNEMRRNMWNSMDTINQHLERNTIEFMVDGWDWQKATEEDDFLEVPRSGEKVHPATWMRVTATSSSESSTSSSSSSTVRPPLPRSKYGNKRPKKYQPPSMMNKVMDLEDMIKRAPELMRRHQKI